MSYLLTAINRCLRAIGETPVNSTDSGLPDAGEAYKVIEDVTYEVLSAGWEANTSRGLTLTPSMSHQIAVPATYLRVDTVDEDRHIHVTVRRDPNDGIAKLYNVKDNTFEFMSPVKVDVVHYFTIDELTFPLQNFISARAARVFQETQMGSVSLDSFTMRAEQEAWAKLIDAEAENADHNALRDSPYMATITGRFNTLSGR